MVNRAAAHKVVYVIANLVYNHSRRQQTNQKGIIMKDEDIIQLCQQAGWDMGYDLSDGFGERIKKLIALVMAFKRQELEQAIEESSSCVTQQQDTVKQLANAVVMKVMTPEA